jgi:uncharacterized protein (TIGR02453 family)
MMGMPGAHDPAGFSGFRPGALQFLADLADNNRRDWFQPRKAEFERLVRDPLAALCVALAARFRDLGLPLLADPVRSPFRIYRDVRFSKDKSPYKTGLGASFAWLGGADAADVPRAGVGGYFHLAPGDIFVGGGMWHPHRERLAAFRSLLDRDPDRVLAALEGERFRAVFGGVGGERLARNPAGYAADHPHSAYLRLKDVIFGRPLSDADVFSADLPDVIARDLDAARLVLELLAALPGGPGPRR